MYKRQYLPKGNRWIDYWTNKAYDGGQWIEVKTQIDRLPLYVRAGSIIPVSEVVEYSAAQADKPVTVLVYPGADASFTLYRDAGDGYDFEKGDYSLTTFTWNDKKKKLKISGNFKTSHTVISPEP